MKLIHQILIGIALLILALSAIYLGIPHTDGIGTISGNNQIQDTQKNQAVPTNHLSLFIQTPIENFIINSSIPASPSVFPLYKGTYQPGDIVEKYFKDVGDIITNETPADLAPEQSKKALVAYGGLPSDAVLGYSKVIHSRKINVYTHEVVESKPMFTQVLFERTINGIPIVGNSDSIGIFFGENGEILQLTKHWRTLEYQGTVPIIPVDKAIKKLEQREIINPPQGPEDAVVTSINLRYYAKSWNDDVIYLEPVWEFYATMPSGEPYQFFVYARQFANFTATPTSGKTPLTVTFTDLSDASPNAWYWDFGDGTNSTEQNPVHQYRTAGTYTVSLKAWNDLGSDMMERPALITLRNPAPPVANFTGSPTSGTRPLSVTFNDTSANGPASWLWTFGDGANATEQNPVHIYSTAGNYTVSLNVTNEDGADSITKPDYITVFVPPPTTQLTTQPTTTVTTTVTTSPTTTTTKPTPTKTHTPLSPIIAFIGIVTIGLLFAIRKKP